MVTEISVDAFSAFVPILTYLVVFLVVLVILQKSKIFEDKLWWQLFLSFFISTLFVSFVGARIFISNAIPFFVVTMVCLFLILLVFGFAGKSMDSMAKPFGIAVAVILVIGFLIIALFVFSDQISPYLPGNSGGDGGNSALHQLFNWFYSSKVAGAILLLLISGLVAWALVGTK